MPWVYSILDDIVPAMLVVCRLGGVFLFAPAISSSVVPVRVRVLLAFVLGLALYPALRGDEGMSFALPTNLWMLGPIVALEILFGALIGFLASLPLLAAQTGGLVMGQQMGLGFARFFNPAIEDEAEVLGQVIFLLTLGGFIIIGGLEQVALGVIHSFDAVALGGYQPDTGVVALMTGLLLASFELALRISAPLLALIFLETIAMGFLAKTVPQLNILSLGFPVRILAGLFVIVVGLVVIDEVMMEGVNEMLSVVTAWAADGGS